VNWLSWAILSAGFAGLTAILAKVGVKDVDANLATAVRTSVVLVPVLPRSSCGCLGRMIQRARLRVRSGLLAASVAR
jgi:uncharacterized membrane protein